MFARLGRLMRAWLGYFVSMAEDPEVMLQDAIEEMRTTMPKLNSVLVATRATVIRLEEERTALTSQERNLAGSIQAALREGSAEARAVAEDGSTCRARTSNLRQRKRLTRRPRSRSMRSSRS
jgi:phage shock protein A